VANQGGGRGAKRSFGVEGVTSSLRHELGLSMQAVSLVYDGRYFLNGKEVRARAM